MKKIKLLTGLTSTACLTACLTPVMTGCSCNKNTIQIEKDDGVKNATIKEATVGGNVVIAIEMQSGYSISENNITITIDGEEIKSSSKTWILNGSDGTITIFNVKSLNIHIQLKSKKVVTPSTYTISFGTWESGETYTVTRQADGQTITQLNITENSTYQEALFGLNVTPDASHKFKGDWTIDGTNKLDLTTKITSNVTIKPILPENTDVDLKIKIYSDKNISLGVLKNNASQIDLSLEGYKDKTVADLTTYCQTNKEISPLIDEYCEFVVWLDESGNTIASTTTLDTLQDKTIYAKYDWKSAAADVKFLTTSSFETKDLGWTEGDSKTLIFDFRTSTSSKESNSADLSYYGLAGLNTNSAILPNSFSGDATFSVYPTTKNWHVETTTIDGKPKVYQVLDSSQAPITSYSGTIMIFTVTIGSAFTNCANVVLGQL